MPQHDDDINASSSISQDDTWVDSIEKALPPPLSSTRIHKVPEMLVRDPGHYDKYYCPKVVSIGPYHYGKLKLEPVERLKPVFTKELLSKYNVGLGSLYEMLGEANMVKELRKFYEEGSTDRFSDEEFTRMMLLDGCFILYCILFKYGERAPNDQVLRRQQIVLVQQDLFLLENQIPFEVLNKMMELINVADRREKFGSFFDDNIWAPGRQKRRWFSFERSDREFKENVRFSDDHLIHRLHYILTEGESGRQLRRHRITDPFPDKSGTLYNVNDLIETGIHFKPSSSMILADVEFVRHYWWFSADLKLPWITLDRLLNLFAFEMCIGQWHGHWVTSYVCLLQSLIEKPDDVKALRNAGIIDDQLGNVNDEEVVIMFKDICVNLIPNNKAYSKLKEQIQNHYNSWNRTHLKELKQDYLKSPWSILAILGGLLVLFLSGVQTYFTVWSPKSECDDLCKFLKMNHHL